MAEELVSPNIWSSEGTVNDPALLEQLRSQFYNQQVAQTGMQEAQAQLLNYRSNDPQLITGFSGLQAERQAAQDRGLQRYNSAISGLTGAAAAQSNSISGVADEYRNIAANYATREGNLNNLLAGYGQSQLNDLEQRRQQASSQAKQDLIKRGLTGATTYDAALRRLNTQADQQRARLQDQLTRQKMDYQAKLSGETLQAQGMAPQVTMDVAKQQFGMQALPYQQAMAFKEQAPTLQAIGSYASALTSI